jgi:hypothetical protein
MPQRSESASVNADDVGQSSRLEPRLSPPLAWSPIAQTALGQSLVFGTWDAVQETSPTAVELSIWIRGPLSSSVSGSLITRLLVSSKRSVVRRRAGLLIGTTFHWMIPLNGVIYAIVGFAVWLVRSRINR